MKVREAIETVDRLHPNTIDAGDKVRWLSELDHSVWDEVIQTKEDAIYVPIEEVENPVIPVPEVLKEFVPYEYGVNEETELLITSPYTEVYIAYLAAKIDMYSNDISSYNNNMQLFNAAYEEYVAWYNRKHMPRSDFFVKGV